MQADSQAERLVAHAEAMEAAAGAFVRAASGEGDAPAGVVRIAASELVGAEILPPIMRRVREAWPQVRAEVSLSDGVEDLLSRRADVAVRMTAPGANDLVARRLRDMRIGLFVRRDLLDGREPPCTVDDVAGLPAVDYETGTIAARRLRAVGMPLPWRNTVFSTDSGLGQLAAIRAGVGMGLSLVKVCGADPDLVHLLPETIAANLESWVVFPRELRAVRRVRIVVEALVDALGRG